MIVYRDTRPESRTVPPPWLAGAADLNRVEDRRGQFRFWGIGNPHLIGQREDFAEVGDGWEMAVAGPIIPSEFRRTLRWCRCVDAEDTQGRTWSVPVILSQGGERIILVSYGRDFLPVLTAEQARAVSVATAARESLLAAHDVGGGYDFSMAARWAAELVSIAHHISIETIGALGVIDEALILSALEAACGLSLRKGGA